MEKSFLLAMGFAIAVIGGFLLFAAWPSLTGVETQLRVAPVDPIDPFIGDYVSLRYDLSRIDASLQDDPFTDGETVYVSLAGGDVQHATHFSHAPPSGRLYLKGVFDGRLIDYGLERLYVPEGSGRVSFWDGANYTVRVRIDARGGGRVLGLLRNGEEMAFEKV